MLQPDSYFHIFQARYDFCQYNTYSLYIIFFYSLIVAKTKFLISSFTHVMYIQVKKRRVIVYTKIIRSVQNSLKFFMNFSQQLAKLTHYK